MNMHSPGPWRRMRALSTERDVFRIIYDQEGERVALIPDVQFGHEDNAMADTRLIQAAPDLLAALQELVGEADLGEVDHDDDTLAMLARARAAIAKATGGES